MPVARWSIAQPRASGGAELQDQGRQRWQREHDRVGLPLPRHRLGRNAAPVALVASPVDVRVGVAQLPIEPGRGRSHPVAAPNHGREVAHDDHEVTWIAGAADERHHALLGVPAVDPLEARRLEVDLVQGALGPVDAVEVAHQPQEGTVIRPPIEGGQT